MTSIALVVFIVGIIYVMIWSIRNDDARSISDQTGFVRMRVPPKSEDAKAGAAGPHAPVTRTAKAKRASAKASAPRPRSGGKHSPAPGHRRPPGTPS